MALHVTELQPATGLFPLFIYGSFFFSAIIYSIICIVMCVCVFFNHIPSQIEDNYLCFVQTPTHRNTYKSLMSSLFWSSLIFANWSRVFF